jgi:hypothetical protein
MLGQEVLGQHPERSLLSPLAPAGAMDPSQRLQPETANPVRNSPCSTARIEVLIGPQAMMLREQSNALFSNGRTIFRNEIARSMQGPEEAWGCNSSA